jgi:hypothetical protein
MAQGQKPDYRVMLPVNSGRGKDAKTVWHRHGAGWKRENGTIGIVLDVGAPVTYEAGTQLVLVEDTDNGREPGQD